MSKANEITADMVRDLIERNSYHISGNIRDFYNGAYVEIADALNAELGTEINGDTSDGYHTFNELYHHRAVLFSVIVHDHRDLAWKARKHHDGTMYDGMFIVGIETPKGQATYHYDLDPYWDMFDCEEREYAPEWDGHTPDEAIERIGLLRDASYHDFRITLTSEQVCDAVYAHSLQAYCADADWDAIADELNAQLRSGRAVK